MQKTDCGTWLNCRNCWTVDGPVIVIQEWNPGITEIVQTKYLLPDGSVVPDPPEGLYCSNEPEVPLITVMDNATNSPTTFPAGTIKELKVTSSSDCVYLIQIGSGDSVEFDMGTVPDGFKGITSINGSRFNEDITITVVSGVLIATTIQ